MSTIDFTLPALSIRQPWAFLILHAGKDIENRRWVTGFRGKFLIHAAKGMTQDELDGAFEFCRGFTTVFPADDSASVSYELQRGGIVGEAEIVDCVQQSKSPWFVGPWGFVIANPKPLPFYPCRGALGFFKVKP